jgi:hypothetical protein
MTMSLPQDQWTALSAEVISSMADWRAAHPRASLTEIEAALDERLARLRARMLQDTALHSPQTHWASTPPEDQPRCPECRHPLQPTGTATRHLQTHGGQELVLPRQYGTCSACGAGVFPPR